MRKTNKTKIHTHKQLPWTLGLVVVVIVVAAAAFGWHEYSIHKTQKTSGTIPTSQKINQTSTSHAANQTTTSGQTDTGTKLPSSTPSSSSVLMQPFGTFVSNHQPGQNGSPTSEQSVCNTTPGATCDIQFTNSSGVTKDLGTETTDSNGSADWSWDVNGATLASGSWHITAIAKLNGQTQTTSDPTTLEIQ